MADVKITALPAISSVSLADVIPIVDDVAGTPATTKATITQVRAALVPVVLTADVTGTLPVANGGTGITSLGSGVATFLGTPSGANLASALSTALPDTKGGTGLTSLGSGVATFLGTPSGANLGTALTSALAASKVVQATGTGIPHVVSGALSAASSLIVDADVDAAAAIAGSKLVAASASVPGSMSAADKTKLDGTQKQGVSTAVSAYDIDWSLGSVYHKTLGAGAQTFTFSNDSSGMVIVVAVTGAASTLSWPSVKWAAGVAPTQTASGTDVYTFVKAGAGAGVIYGSVVQAMA